MNENKRKILVAAAWPYANGSLHLGHVAALIGSDVLARFFRLNGNEVLFVSGSDCHGTPIALKANEKDLEPSEIANRYHEEFVNTLVKGLNFSYDVYTKTTTKNHYKVVQDLFLDLYNKGYIYSKVEKLPYCDDCQKFLPDRYIEGECPVCGYDSARGDQCDDCGNLVDVKKIKKSKCKLCGSEPEFRDSEHFFLKITTFQDVIKEWVKKSKDWRANAKNFTLEFLNQGLIDRAITRDTQWGVPVPLDGYEDKRIYVWFEAVCGYLSASKEWANLIGSPEKWKEFWKNEDAIHYYVHGKDNIPFHTIIWPSILLASELHLPDRIISSEYLTLERKQFSKSRNWAVWLPDFLDNFDSETLRYYLISSGSETSDADFSWREFLTKTNSELIGNFGNYVHRVLSFIQKKFPEGVNFPDNPDEEALEFLRQAQETFSLVADSITRSRFKKGLRHIFALVEEGNRYLNASAPWKTINDNPSKAEHDLAVAAHVIKCLAILINPYLPKSSERICSQIELDVANLSWEYPSPDFLLISKTRPLYRKIEEEEVEKQRSLLKGG